MTMVCKERIRALEQSLKLYSEMGGTPDDQEHKAPQGGWHRKEPQTSLFLASGRAKDERTYGSWYGLWSARSGRGVVMPAKPVEELSSLPLGASWDGSLLMVYHSEAIKARPFQSTSWAYADISSHHASRFLLGTHGNFFSFIICVEPGRPGTRFRPTSTGFATLGPTRGRSRLISSRSRNHIPPKTTADTCRLAHSGSLLPSYCAVKDDVAWCGRHLDLDAAISALSSLYRFVISDEEEKDLTLEPAISHTQHFDLKSWALLRRELSDGVFEVQVSSRSDLAKHKIQTGHGEEL